MHEHASDPGFDCPSCAARYVWLPRLAGRKVRCHCGCVLRVAQQAGEPAELLEAVLADTPRATGHRDPAGHPGPHAVELDTATPPHGSQRKPPTRRCDHCGQAVAQAARLCTRCGRAVNAPATSSADAPPADSPITAYIEPDADTLAAVDSPAMDHRKARAQVALEQVRQRYEYDRSVEQEASTAARVMHVIFPGVLIALGLVMLLAHALMYQPVGMQAMGMALPLWVKLMSHTLVVTVHFVFLFIGLLLVARLFGNAVGTLTITLWRLLAMAVFCVASDAMVTWGIEVITEGVAWLGSYVRLALLATVFFPLANLLLDLDIMESVVLFLLSRLLPMFVAFFTVMIVYSMFE